MQSEFNLLPLMWCESLCLQDRYWCMHRSILNRLSNFTSSWAVIIPITALPAISQPYVFVHTGFQLRSAPSARFSYLFLKRYMALRQTILTVYLSYNLGPSITCHPPIVVSSSRSRVKQRQWVIDRLQGGCTFTLELTATWGTYDLAP